MKCTVHFFLLNDHFSQEHADSHYGGKESELNRIHQWEDELAITTDVQSIEIHEGCGFPLQGQLPDGTDFNEEVKNMRLFELKGSNTSNFVGCSESILSHFEEIKEDDRIVLKIYIKDNEPHGNPIPGIYIASLEFPEILMD